MVDLVKPPIGTEKTALLSLYKLHGGHMQLLALQQTHGIINASKVKAGAVELDPQYVQNSQQNEKTIDSAKAKQAEKLRMLDQMKHGVVPQGAPELDEKYKNKNKNKPL